MQTLPSPEQACNKRFQSSRSEIIRAGSKRSVKTYFPDVRFETLFWETYDLGLKHNAKRQNVRLETAKVYTLKL